jgi:hypothetical protein
VLISDPDYRDLKPLKERIIELDPDQVDLKYLLRIIAFGKANNIKLYCDTAPYYHELYKTHDLSQQADSLAKLAKEHEIDYLDFGISNAKLRQPQLS